MSATDELTPAEKHTLTLAREALLFGIQGRTDRARKVILRINDEYGGEGLGLTLQAWADTYLRKIGYVEGSPVRITFMNADNGVINDNADDVPGTVSWAGRMLTARAAKDWQTWDALLAAVPDDEAAMGEHVLALFQMVSLNLRHIDRIRRAGGAS